MKKVLILLLSALMLFTLVGCSGGGSETGGDEPVAEKKVLRFNVGFDPDTFDPQESWSLENAMILTQCYDFLYRENEKGEFVPSLAESYEMSEDGTVYTFKLREGLTFADGSPLTAKDVKFSWLHALAPENAFEYAYQLYYIKNAAPYNAGECAAEEVGLEVVDDTTLVVTLEKPTAYFLSLTGFITYAVISEDFATKQDKYGADAASMLSSGPFVVDEWNKGQYVKYVKNEKYWDAANVNLDELYIYAVTESSTEITMFETNELDVTYMTMTSADTLRLKDQLKYWSSLNTRYLICNVEDETLSDPNVRKALMYALDLDTLAETVVLNCVAAEGYIPNDMSAVDDPSKVFRKEKFLETSGNVDLAKQYLADAGYPDGAGFPEDLEIVYTTGDANKALAEAIVEMWRVNLGVNIKATNLEGTVRKDRKNNGDFDFSLDGWSTDYLDPYSFLEIGLTGNIYNSGRYSNPEFDRLVGIASTSLDQVEREEAMEAAEKIFIVEDMAVLPLYNSIRAYLAKDGVSGIVFSKTGIADFKSAKVSQ